ncbi:MAG: FG-GAP repeat domain-containing protein [Kofleriaceae bacterium]
MCVRGGLLFVLLLGGCYSPSFDTCSLRCATNEKCPNGYDCSNGRCAIEGSTCSPSDGDIDDGMRPDLNTATCGNMTRDIGEICFAAPVQYDTDSNIFDAQFIDANGNGVKDLVFATSTNYGFRLNDGGFETTTRVGPQVNGMLTFRGEDLDGDTVPELVNHNTSGNIEIYRWNNQSNVWGLASSAVTEMAAVPGVAIGRTPRSIAIVSSTMLRIFGLPSNGLVPTPVGSGFGISGGRDIAIGDTDNDGTEEIAIAQMFGVSIFNSGSSMSPFMQATDAVVACNVDGDSNSEFVYTIKSAGLPGRVGSLRWTSSATYEVTPRQDIDNMLADVACEDLDNDGKDDAILVSGSLNNWNLLVLRGRADATFEPPVTFEIPSSVTHINVGDYNNDLAPDLVLTSNRAGGMASITVLTGDP